MKQVLLFLVMLPLVTSGAVAQPRPATVRGTGATYEVHRCEAMAELGLSMYFDWSPTPGSCGGVQSLPWIYCDRIPDVLGGNSVWTGFGNEPDNPNQCNRSPVHMAVAWDVALMKHPGREWVAPNTYSIEWADEWLSLISIMPSALGIHCYEMVGGAGYCEGHWERAIALAEKYGINEVWITEYAYVPISGEGYDGAVEAMQNWLAYVESEPMITTVFWFQLTYHGDEPWAWGRDRNTSLVDFITGEVTQLGEAYRLPGEIIWAPPEADTNDDGIIDILDLAFVGAHFGQRVRGR